MSDDFYCDEALSGRTKVRVVRETPAVLAFHHTRPHWPVHIVVVPKRHVPSLVELGGADEGVLHEVLAVVREIAAQVTAVHGACRVLTNLGRYQDSKHLHFHVNSGEPLTRQGTGVALRPTEAGDLAFVLALERDPENTPFVGQWSEAEHAAALASTDREHWVIRTGPTGERAGFLVAYDLRASGLGVFVKRIVVAEKSRGVGRAALAQLVEHAFRELEAPFVWLSVYGENLRAQRSYAALGFRVAELDANARAAHHAAVGGFSDRSLLMFRGP